MQLGTFTPITVQHCMECGNPAPSDSLTDEGTTECCHAPIVTDCAEGVCCHFQNAADVWAAESELSRGIEAYLAYDDGAAAWAEADDVYRAWVREQQKSWV